MTNAKARATEVARFVAAGGIAAGANVLSRIVFSHWFSLPIAVILAYLVGMAVAFVLMRRYVFPPGRFGMHRQIAVFVLVNVAAVMQTLLITLLLADFVLPRLGVTEHADLIAHIAGVCVPIMTSFVGHKRWSFR
jgi:putative flippase GtrA